MLVSIRNRLFLCNEEGKLLGVRWTDLFADEDVGERLIAVDNFGVVGCEYVLVQLPGKYW